MAYLYFTPYYERNYQTKYGRMLESAFEKIRTTENPYSFIEQYEHSPIWKMRVGERDKYRLILQKVNIHIDGVEYEVFCAKGVILRGSKDYKKKNWKSTIDTWMNIYPIDEEAIRLITSSIVQQIAETNTLPPKLPDSLMIYTAPVKDIHLSKSDIYESREWIFSIKKQAINTYYEEIREFIGSIHSEMPIATIIEESGVFKISKTEHLYIVYAQFEFPECEENEAKKIAFLFDVFTEGSKILNVIQEVKQKYPYTTYTHQEKLMQDCKRAYHSYLVCESDLWTKIENDEKANMVFSLEERKILMNPTFPLFINGQAGSGKSTVLYYLFAYFYALGHENKLPANNCLFFTYNKHLLSRAKENINAILQNNYTYVEQNIDVCELNQCFYTLQDFVKEKLISNKDQMNFIDKNYLSFSKFKQYYLGKTDEKEKHCPPSNRNKYSPDLVWHIIRTYIKGYHLNRDFSLDEYKNLLPRDRIVNSDVYEDVVNTIWKNWYSRFYDEFNMWDDQDLIRYVLQHVQNHRQSPVLFCDEIQDFTRIELDLIWRLSSFSQYDLSGQSNIPFVFAGDPNQTVHPTGFHWSSLSKLFKERFKKMNLGDLSINEIQLFQNYRSKSAIIKFSNLIQRFRYQYLDIQELAPQIPWQKVEGFSPCIFILHEDIEMEDLKEILKNTDILLPTSRSERDYIRKNPLLKQLNLIPKNENMPIPNIMNAASAKGLEYDKVVLYNFGDHAPAAFQKCVNQQERNDDEKIELIHFFNKLYVAISRASNFLYIIDTQKGYANFWKYFMASDLLPFSEDNNWPEKHLLPLSKGIKADIENIKKHDAHNTAQVLRQMGISQENNTLLLRAQQYYQSVHHYQEALFCSAWANWYGKNWLEAGKYFSQLNDIEKASTCFWKICEWQSLKELHENHNNTHPHLLLANYMLGEIHFHKIIDNTYFTENCSAISGSWETIVAQLQADFENNIVVTGVIQYEDYAFYAEKIGKKGFNVFYDIAGTFYFNDKKYSEAIKCWDKNHDSASEDSFSKKRTHYLPYNYYNAKIACTKNTNKKLPWLQRLKYYEKIIELSKNNSNKHSQKINTEGHRIIFDTLIRKKYFEDAINYRFIPLHKRSKKILDKITHFGGANDKIRERKKKIFEVLLNSHQEGAKILLSNLETFKFCFNENSALEKILNNSDWKKILAQYQNQYKTNIPTNLFKGLLSYVANLQWSESDAENEVIETKFDYALQLIQKEKHIAPQIHFFRKLFYKFTTNPLGIALIKKYPVSFKFLFSNEKILEEVLTNHNENDLLKDFEEEFKTALSDQYTKSIIDIVSRKINNSDITHLPYTLQLIEHLSEPDKLLQYIKLINAVPIPDSDDSTLDVLSDTLKNHLLTIVEKSIHSSTKALSPDSSKPE